MANEPQTQSIQARIAAINLAGNLDHVGRAPITAIDRPVPEKPPRPQLEQRSQTTRAPQTLGHNSFPGNAIGNEPNGPKRDGVLPPPSNIVRTGQKISPPAKPAPPPRLPARKSTQPSPALPPRKTSENLSRKASNESISSVISNVSTISALSGRPQGSRAPSMDGGRIKAPVFDPTTLPKLPPKRTKEDVEKRYQDIEKSKAFPGYKDVERKRTALIDPKNTPSISTVELTPHVTPSLPPRRPSRPEFEAPARKVPPEHPSSMPARSALSYGMNKIDNHERINGFQKRDTSPTPLPQGAPPPPVPISSRPDLSKLLATKPKQQPQLPGLPSTCLLCRDFSLPDKVAAQYPRESVPSLDWLATQLTSPFSSPTDQARCIFTWLHHNISYDVVSFFNGCVKPSTPASTLDSGLAVCEGYAGLFTAIASKAGLQSLVVGGHGKGFGYAAIQPGTAIPPESSNHAWNAVKIDNGEWKLIDTCWGAGHIDGPNRPYQKKFSPRFFTMSNEDFGRRHFPSDKSQFFRSNGRALSWHEYIVGDGGGELVRIFSGVAEQEGVNETSLLPKYLKLPISPSAHQGPTVRFQFARVCEHWDPVSNGAGKPYVFILSIHGLDGREKDFVSLETNGAFWWADVEPRRLGCAGQTITLFTVETVNGQSGRGLSVDEYRMAKGRKAMSFGGVAAWELV